ncbi:hypothetical protein Tco_1514666 [Tanacetum coccineum]
MLLNVDQLQKQLDKDEFQEDGSMTAFWVVNNQFQKFIDSKFTLDYDSQMTDTTGLNSAKMMQQVRMITDADDADIRPIYDEEPMAEKFIKRAVRRTTSNELDLLFGPLFDEYFNGENQVVLKSSAVTTTDASNKRQQQPDSTSSTSTLASTVTANGNFYL